MTAWLIAGMAGDQGATDDPEEQAWNGEIELALLVCASLVWLLGALRCLG